MIKQFGYLLCFYAILLKNGQGKNSVPKCSNFVQCFLPVVYDIQLHITDIPFWNTKLK